MLNKEFILDMINPYLNNKRELSSFEFNELFSNLTKKEQYEVIDIMIQYDIEYVDEKSEEKQILDKVEILQKKPIDISYKKILNLKNEQLCEMYRAGNKTALVALIEKNKRFIYKYAMNFESKYKKSILTVDDFYEEGILGLVKAADNFNVNLGYAFLTYSSYWIDQKMRRAVADQGYIVRLPVYIHDEVCRVNGYRKKYPSATKEELLEIINENSSEDKKIDLEKLDKFIMYGEIYYSTASLNICVGEEADTELIDLLPKEEESTEDTVDKIILKDQINIMLDSLSKKERDIIEYRFGLNDKEPLTLEEIGSIFNVTRERIRQIEAKVIRKLRHPTRSKLIKDFYY